MIYFDDGTYLFGLEEITVVNIRTPTPRRKPSSRHTNVVIVKNYNDNNNNNNIQSILYTWSGIYSIFEKTKTKN